MEPKSHEIYILDILVALSIFLGLMIIFQGVFERLGIVPIFYFNMEYVKLKKPYGYEPLLYELLLVLTCLFLSFIFYFKKRNYNLLW